MNILDKLQSEVKVQEVPEGYFHVFQLMETSKKKMSVTTARHLLREGVAMGRLQTEKFRCIHNGKPCVLTHYKWK